MMRAALATQHSICLIVQRPRKAFRAVKCLKFRQTFIACARISRAFGMELQERYPYIYDYRDTIDSPCSQAAARGNYAPWSHAGGRLCLAPQQRQHGDSRLSSGGK